MLQMLVVFAECEADAISARTKAALSAKNRQGNRLGGRRSNSTTMDEMGRPVAITVIKAKVTKRAADLLPLIDEIKAEIESAGETGHALTDRRRLECLRRQDRSRIRVERRTGVTCAGQSVAAQRLVPREGHNLRFVGGFLEWRSSN